MLRIWLGGFAAMIFASVPCVLSHAAEDDARSQPVSSRDEKPLPLGQLLLVGFKGTDMKENLSDVIKETKPGGILLFGRNVKSAEQVAQLNFSAQKLSKRVSDSPLLIAIDQEGGNVIRIRHTPRLPSALAIAKTRSVSLARRAGAATGQLLRTLGINVNLAPVVDVVDPQTDQFLGTRSFGSDPKKVAAMTTAVAQGLQENGVLPIAKHFPGHGDAAGDSHVAAISSPADRDQLYQRDLVPYFSLAKNLAKPWGAMLAHVSFPAVDESGDPATFSKALVGGIFRREISENALVITDDIEMAGAGAEKDVGLRAVRAIEAGADMVMIAWSRKIQKQVLKALADAVESGRLKRSRVEQALRHISRAKNIYAAEELKLASHRELSDSMKNPEFTSIADSVLRAAVRNLRERQPANVESGESLVPSKIKPSREPILVLSARFDFLESFRKAAKGFHVKTMVLRPSRRDAIEKLLSANPESPVFVYVSGRQVAEFITGLDESFTRRMIVVNVETRTALGLGDHFRDIFDVHYRHPDLGKVVAEGYLDMP